MDEEFISGVISLYDNNKWSDILNLDVDIRNEKVHSLLWVWPSKENLLFISHMVKKFHLEGILSIGCGTGLFEWLLQQCTNIPVTGIEVDQSWWSSKYAKYKFMPLQFINMPPDSSTIRSDYALLFCYFNNGLAFKEYIQCYQGNLVFIVGPGKERGTLTNPEPFSPDFGSTKWNLFDYQEVKNTKDFIAVYTR